MLLSVYVTTCVCYYVCMLLRVYVTSQIFDDVQLLCTIIGCIANSLTLLVLFLNYKGFSRVILVLLRHQSIADAWVCLMAAILIKQVRQLHEEGSRSTAHDVFTNPS